MDKQGTHYVRATLGSLVRTSAESENERDGNGLRERGKMGLQDVDPGLYMYRRDKTDDVTTSLRGER